MFGVKLFLGFPVNGSLSSAIEKMDPQIVDLFIQEGDNYLKQVIYQDVRYLGKFAGEICDIGSLELLEKNVYSLLKKLISDYPYEDVSLVLFPAAASSSSSSA